MKNEEILKRAIEKYHVTPEGRVFNNERGNELKPGTYKNGYKYICFYINKEVTKKIKVHRMVALRFIPNPENKPHVNHINCNPGDNRVENLEWCTAKENVIHGFKNGRQVWNKGNISKKQVLRLARRYPRKLFWHLTTNNFQVAKAFFGEESNIYQDPLSGNLTTKKEKDNYVPLNPAWQFHLQQMVVSEDVFKYLESYL